ncbi:Vitamin B12 transporter BtuB [Zhongshania aliphaticivorans]|uniref:Vitamin B12 transporter BtuB n=1 Tax=Zhongshania aliphaticivorans TaxID=1470434 RepID=A0A5S9QS88_9GAMM|nr:TonB-dependent receptor [Zhongshania aliphaticivorans]CAA0109710.1 Vitamin B12 transporter BtuB [Zhongshania aliphaticivorans]CAA0117865.1 Vitamin B12 transporter BtuB [Zhongshania aliphaticivorans]CAA0121595.1 Vitamin B12 transporter BtuB [Zhongshania aliphaticivorans]
MNKITLAAAGSIFTMATSPIFAAEQSHIETTVVTATRTEQSVADILAPVTVFERADIERIQPNDLQELLSRAVGVSFVRNGGRGASTSLFLRGNQSNHTLVLIDGVRIGSATNGAPALTNLPPELIERVEIVRGSRSSLYGSEAIGGVINIITRKYHDTDGLEPMLQIGIGTQGSRKVLAAISGGDAQTQVNISVLREETDGVDNTSSKAGVSGDDDAFEQTAINASLSHKINDAVELFAFYQHSQTESDYDNNCYDSAYNKYECSPYTDGAAAIANIRGEFRPTDNWLLSLSAGESKDESTIEYHYIDPAATGISGDTFDTTRRVYSLQNDWMIGEHHVITLGFERLLDHVKSNLSYGEQSRGNKAIFAQWQADLGLVDFTIGGRNDDNDQFGTNDTGNASIGLDISDAIKVIASYGEGFNAPTFNDLYYPFYGVPTLEPETSENIELELRGNHDWGSWSVARFENDVDKLIQYNPATFGPDQIEGAEIKGWEMSVSSAIKDWSIDANISLLDATDANSGLDLRRRADKQANVDIGREWQHWGVSGSLRLVSSRFEDTANTDELAGYGLVDSTVFYRVNEQVKLQLALKNIFDKEYVSARSFSFGDYLSIGREAMFSITYTPK